MKIEILWANKIGCVYKSDYIEVKNEDAFFNVVRDFEDAIKQNKQFAIIQTKEFECKIFKIENISTIRLILEDNNND